ncbi:phosphate ABC transporter permease subunit PstC [Limosilactobacillus ingluviei]|uniref:Phosphate transport system permease protein n=1 Tax=Limosilactobacillus ingluviei DSM 15946 TaxID=1423760 RepID=A0A0R1UD08_9LACO|nr:phosphate ABC transporter permease subunit PstC [Limosilactobacillus ingluviei]KRL91295.1 phosphate ABC transporter permease [Limosilactobacillus ingluviei DSM 15946]MBM6728370.1 phosphate ABC transporter permease subunit PstC [Limosilactobacillus ingluviei]HJG49875.1 phosphate ABC transporter permease subunit PstC [Limosilactobacillus ingluviei]
MENWHTYLTGASKERQQERRGRWLTSLALLVIGALVVTILLFLIAKGVRLFTTGEGKLTEFFFSPTWAPGAGVFGAAPMIVTSLIVTVVAGLIGLPFALAVALAVTEILPPVAKKLLQPVIELLVGIPSVVYGLVGLTVIVPAVRQLVGGTGFGLVAAVGVLYLMIMPTMTSMAIEALQAVPKQQRQASAGLGATRWQTIHRVVLPAARGGILTAMIFGMARAFGEALAVQMVIGNAAIMPTSLQSSAATLTSVLTTGMGNTIMGTAANDALWALALVLLAMSLLFNLGMRLVTKKG